MEEDQIIVKAIQQGKGSQLEAGRFGIVMIYQLAHKKVAVKHITFLRVEDIEELVGEHFSVLPRQCLHLPGRPYIKMPYSALGNLNKDYLHEARTLPETLQDMLQISQGLEYLQLVEIVHGNVKPENVLVWHQNGSRVLKLTDYGMELQGFDVVNAAGFGPFYTAALAQSKANAEERSAMFAPPKSGLHTYRDDVFSSSLLFWSIIPPTFEDDKLVPKFFVGGTWHLLNKLVENHDFDSMIFVQKYFHWDKKLGTFLMKMLEKESRGRPDITEVVKVFKDCVHHVQSIPSSWQTQEQKELRPKEASVVTNKEVPQNLSDGHADAGNEGVVMLLWRSVRFLWDLLWHIPRVFNPRSPAQN